MISADTPAERGQEPLTAEQLAGVVAHLGGARPATTDLILSIGQSIKDRREHEHPHMAEDFFCANLSGWMGDKMPTVLRRLLDAEADNARLRARVAESEALAADAVEYRVSGRDGRWLWVRRAPNGSSWAVLEPVRSSVAIGRWALLLDGWRLRDGLDGAEVFVWPSAETAVAEARRALAEGGEQRG